MEQNLPWKKTSFEEVESRGILAGEEVNGTKVYVGRTLDKDGTFVPAKVVPANKLGYYAYNGTEESSDQVEILENSANCHWVKSDGLLLEDAAVVSGFQIGRALYNGNVVVGRVDLAAKELIGSYGGEAFSLPSYDVLIYKSRGVVYETIQKASNFSRVSNTLVNGHHEESSFSNIQLEQENYINLVNRIRSLEIEKLSYQKDKQSYEQRLEFEQKKVVELSNFVRKLKIENIRFSKDRSSFEEKFTSEQQRVELTEQRLREYALNNSYLLKKVTSLEEAIRIEKALVESISEKFTSSQSYSKSLFTRLTSFEETIRTQQEKIFELESEIMISSSSSESLLKRVSDYEETIKNLRIQLELLEKKLEISSNDNDYLVQRLAMLTKILRSYQSQIEILTNKVQSSKTVIASAHAELSRVNAQVAKYQSALSGCYSLNGDLMTKVSGLNVIAQNQTGGESSLHLINYASDYGYGSKSSVYSKTSSLLEMSTSESFTGFEEAQAYGNFTPFLPEEQQQPQAYGFTKLQPEPENNVTSKSQITTF